jgi:hypothetical protein
MYIINFKRIFALVLLLGSAGLAHAFGPANMPPDEIAPPDLPPACTTSLQPRAETEVVFHVYAIGVQIYRWNGTAWVFVAPSANLFADDSYHGRVGTHYAGPTWESVSGSKVVARRTGDCTPDTSAISWLLLDMVSTDGPGIFSTVTQIQRVNTTGGLVPTVPGTTVGQEARVPYTAEYYFYQLED